jgi:hypothetical protein
MLAEGQWLWVAIALRRSRPCPSTTNNKQQTTNNKQQTTNNEQGTSYKKSDQYLSKKHPLKSNAKIAA